MSLSVKVKLAFSIANKKIKFMPRTSVPTYLLGQKAGFYDPAFFVPVFYFGKFFKEQPRDEVVG